MFLESAPVDQGADFTTIFGRMRMIPVSSLDEVMADVPSNTKGYIMPRGAALRPVPVGYRKKRPREE